MRIGVIGAGAISGIYLDNFKHRFANCQLGGICSLHTEHARQRAEEFQIPLMPYGQMLTDPSIELVVNLTPTQAHASIIRDAFVAGKHVYTEKVICPTKEEAKELLDLAERKKVRLGCAPDTFLGASVQTAADAIRRGLIGVPTTVTAYMNRNSHMGYVPGRFSTQRGGGVGFDMGIYYLTAILQLLGPVVQASGFIHEAGHCKVIRPGSEHIGEDIFVDNEDRMVASLSFANGVLGTLTFNGQSSYPEKPGIILMGTEGVLYLPDPNCFGQPVHLLRAGERNQAEPSTEILPMVNRYTENCRGLGVSEMVDALAAGRPHACAAEVGLHALEVLEAIVRSAECGQTVAIKTCFSRGLC